MEITKHLPRSVFVKNCIYFLLNPYRKMRWITQQKEEEKIKVAIKTNHQQHKPWTVYTDVEKIEAENTGVCGALLLPKTGRATKPRQKSQTTTIQIHNTMDEFLIYHLSHQHSLLTLLNSSVGGICWELLSD